MSGLPWILAGALAVIGLILAVMLWEKHRGLRRIQAAIAELEQGNLSFRLHSLGSSQYARLAAEVNRLAETVQAERIEAARRSKVHRRLLADISHDLRTPLTSVAGYLDALHRGLGDDPFRYLEIAAAKTEELTHLVDDLFFLTRLDSGDLLLETKTLNLAELLRQVVLSFEPQLTQDGVSVEVLIPEVSAPVCGDEMAIRRILTNLIGNSLRHGKGKTRFRVELAEERGSYQVTVEDDGQGFDAGVIAAFQRGASNEGGTGLGLSIALSLAERQGIELTASSEPFRRTAFILRVPIWTGVRVRKT